MEKGESFGLLGNAGFHPMDIGGYDYGLLSEFMKCISRSTKCLSAANIQAHTIKGRRHRRRNI
ncbi:hypothetical protein [Bacillus sp. FJAT-27916]|uniref:hypothetical protein n=1 Tax=Bacillus sp. FJAT-27916 TaxID=1679169 RepID=UPI001E36E7B7|nr:hypothetical protein [Bacillus sp. FJAT-27916]